VILRAKKRVGGREEEGGREKGRKGGRKEGRAEGGEEGGRGRASRVRWPQDHEGYKVTME